MRIAPSQARASSRAMDRPSPLPGGPPRPACPRRKRSKTSSRSSSSMPAPRSLTSMRPGKLDTSTVVPAASSGSRSPGARRGCAPDRRGPPIRPRPPRRGRCSSRDPALPCVKAPALNRRRGHIVEIDPSSLQPALAGAAEDEQFVDGAPTGGRPRRSPPPSRAPRRRRRPRPAPPPDAGAARSAACAADAKHRPRTARWASSRRAIRSVISLNEPARERCSRLPSSSARASRSPPATRRATRSRRWTGPAIWRAMMMPAASPSASTIAAIRTSPSSARRTAAWTAATLWVTRTAPAGRPS